MVIERIALGKLVEHPANANVMGPERLAKLRGHIERSGRYEPLVVRPHPVRAGCYELLNGHHRKRVLAELGHAEAACVVWEVSDGEALELLATLNRLTGSDEPTRRAALLGQLARRFDKADLVSRLPESGAALEKMLSVERRPVLAKVEETAAARGAMVFFVTRAERRTIDEALRRVRAEAGQQEQEAEKEKEKEVGRGTWLARLAGKYIDNV